jgi:hypothetical protein
MNWTPEPWQHIYQHDTHKVKRDRAGRMLGTVTMDLDDYDHALECVNALAGIADPAATLKGIYNALVEIARLGVDVQFCSEDQRGFHARRIRQIAGVAAKSLGEIYYSPNPVQEIALSPEQKP